MRTLRHESARRRAKQEILRNLASFTESTRFGISFFDQGLVQHPPSGQPSMATPESKATASSWVAETPGGGGSCVAKGVGAALLFANRSQTRRNVVIFLGDGCTTCPGKDSAAYGAEALTLTQALNIKGVPIHAFVLGPPTEVCPSFPKALAFLSGGMFVLIPR